MLKRALYTAGALFSPLVFFSILFVSILRTIGFYDFGNPNSTLADLIFNIYGGLSWDQIPISPREITSWLIILFPALFGLATNFPNELSSRIHLSLHRYKSETHWWLIQVLGVIFFVFAVMLTYTLVTLAIGFLAGMRGLTQFLPDADGFLYPSPIAWLLPVLAAGLQMLQFSLIFAVSFLFFRDSRISVFLYITPIILDLMAHSNEEIASSVNGFVNWGMAKRYTLYYSFGISAAKGIQNLLYSIAFFALLGILFAKTAKPAARKNK